MSTYYVDYENVASSGLAGIEKLAAEDIVNVLYSIHTKSIPMDVVNALLKSPASVKFFKVPTGQKNALDFQLVALMFYQADKNVPAYIVSGDTGYDAALSMGKQLGLTHIKRIKQIKDSVTQAQGTAAQKTPKKTAVAVEEPPKSETPAKPRVPHTEKQLSAEIRNHIKVTLGFQMTPEEAMDIVKAVETTKTQQAFYQYFNKKMGTTKASAFYKNIKTSYPWIISHMEKYAA